MKCQHYFYLVPQIRTKTLHWSGILRVFQEQQLCQDAWKMVWNTFWCLVFLETWGQGYKMSKNKGTSLSHTYIRKRILSPGLENNEKLKRIFHRFPGILAYGLILENSKNSTKMYSFSPFYRTLFSSIVSLSRNQDIVVWHMHLDACCSRYTFPVPKMFPYFILWW